MLAASAKWCFVCCGVNHQKTYRGDWRAVIPARALARAGTSGNERSLREREGDAASEELAATMKRIGELTMENEMLPARVGHVGPLGGGFRANGRLTGRVDRVARVCEGLGVLR